MQDLTYAQLEDEAQYKFDQLNARVLAQFKRPAVVYLPMVRDKLYRYKQALEDGGLLERVTDPAVPDAEILKEGYLNGGVLDKDFTGASAGLERIQLRLHNGIEICLQEI